MNYRKLIFWLYGIGVLLFIVAVLINNFTTIDITTIPGYLFLTICLINPVFAMIYYKKNKSKNNFQLIIITLVLFLLLLLIFLPTITELF